MKVIELNDSGITVSDESGVLTSSPGYATMEGQTLVFGHRAEQLSRLNPNASFNHFWHKLGLDPLPHPTPPYRHYADIAFEHLKFLADEASLDGDVLFALPANFSRQQVAVLLGLVGQCPFRAAGLVDSAVAAAAGTQLEPRGAAVRGAEARGDNIIYADIQLHQTLLSSLSSRDGELTREAYVEVPGTGWANAMDSLLALITDAFIRQCRFDPQHNAKSEQDLANALPGWLRQESEESGSLLLELEQDGAVYRAKMPRASLSTKLTPMFEKIEHQLRFLLDETRSAAAGTAQLLFSESLWRMPGLVAHVGAALDEPREPRMVPATVVPRAALQFREQIASEEEAMRFVTRLRLPLQAGGQTVPESDESAGPDTTEVRAGEPTHLLCDGFAYALSPVVHIVGSDTASAPVRIVTGERADRAEDMGRIEILDNRLYFYKGAVRAEINGHDAAERELLRTGDRLRLASAGSDAETTEQTALTGQELQLINVGAEPDRFYEQT